MQTKYFSFFKKYYIIYIILYVGAFSLLLTGINGLTNELPKELPACSQTEAATPQEKNSESLQNLETSRQIQENIAKNIIRLHVIANSDSDTDQQMKLAVRDEIITSLQDALKKASSTSEAAKIILMHTDQIQADALHVLSRYNNDYTIKVSLQPRYFPIKQYGDLSFPAGTYQALCVEIGKAEGRNWWCVLFPSLCFVDETTATVPDDSKETLKNSLTPEEYQTISEPPATSSPRPEVRSGIADWFHNIWNNE